MADVRQEILEYLKAKEYKLDKLGAEDLKDFTTIHIANSLCISRGLASQYLNSLFKEKKLVKIQSKPVYFLEVSSVEQFFGLTVKKNIFDGIEEFVDYLTNERDAKEDFYEAIGHDLSLAYPLSQCKAALEYSEEGIPFILHGARGTGKSFIGYLIYKYCLIKELIPPSSKMLIVTCKNFDKTAATIGIEEISPTLKRNAKLKKVSEIAQNLSEHTLIFFDDLDYLDHFTQYLLLNQFTKQFRMFASALQIETMNEAVRNQFPISVELPLLENRSLVEKKQFLRTAMFNEERKLKKSLRITQSAMNFLLQAAFEGNLIDFNNLLISSAVFSNSDSSQEIIINRMSLPNELPINEALGISPGNEEVLLSPNDIVVDNFAEVLSSFSKKLFRQLTQQLTHSFDEEVFVKQAYGTYAELADYLIYEQNYNNGKIIALQHAITELFTQFSTANRIMIPANFMVVLARYLFSKYQLKSSEVGGFTDEQTNQINYCLAIHFKDQSYLAEELLIKLESALNLTLDSTDKLLLFINIARYNTNMVINRNLCFIICHGYSTASSIADVTNSILGKKIYTPIDMPIDSNAQDILKKLYDYLSKYQQLSYERIVVLIDMGSLSEVGVMLKDFADANIYLIDNVTTSLALEIGLHVGQNTLLDKDMEEICGACTCKYVKFESGKKKDAVLFISDINSNMAEEFSLLFKKSLPVTSDITIAPIDSRVVNDRNLWNETKEEYNVLFISGMSNHKINDAEFIPIEEVITQEALEKVEQIFQTKSSMSNEEIEIFQKNLAKSFSLENIIESITFLDPIKLFHLVEDSIYQLEIHLAQKFSIGTKMGLYIHVSCLIEKLVTKQRVISYEGIPSLADPAMEQKIMNSFMNIKRAFDIEIPKSEIDYIAYYIGG